jgi:4-diphosphocytidyl-2-C-methyl-D-erythritol kinase
MNGPTHGTAYAKINLALHVRGRRDDGYHDLETIFAFLDCGDSLTVEPADQFALEIDGKFGASLAKENIPDNLIFRAAMLHQNGCAPAIRFKLRKNLPIASGLGGGSADAAAALRLLNGYFSPPLSAEKLHKIATDLGADVPACINSVPVMGRGTGTFLEPVENDVSGLFCLLVNPNVAMSTGPVFKAWDGIDHGPLPKGTARELLQNGRNDLEIPAISLCPEISEILVLLEKTRPVVARMSGSGASCFAIYEDKEILANAATEITSHCPTYWTMTGCLR